MDKKGACAPLPLIEPLHVIVDSPTTATGEGGEIYFTRPNPVPNGVFNRSVSMLSSKQRGGSVGIFPHDTRLALVQEDD